MKKLLATIAIVTVLAVGAVVLWTHADHPSQAAALAQPPRVPVTVSSVSQQDVPILLDGVGTVQAWHTISIHPQVDGMLQRVEFKEGQEVKKGAVLVQIDPRFYQAALDQAKAKKVQDEAQLVSAEKDLTRYKTLGLNNAVSQQTIDQQQAKVDQLKGMIKADQAAIESAQTQLAFTTIVAPTDGRMGIRQVDPGNQVRATDSTPIAVLTQTHPVAVLFTLPAGNLDEIRAALARGSVEVLAYDQNDARLLSRGTLELIDNEIDQATNTLRLKAKFANEDNVLWPGEFVHARLLVDTLKGAVTIPPIAVQRGPDGLFAWAVGANGTAEPRPITVGPTTDRVVVVTKGLAEGDQVVVSGQSRLQTGSAVDAQPLAHAVAAGPAP